MPLRSIEAMLREEIGLNPESIGAGGVEHAVRRRMACCELESLPRYLVFLQGSREELDRLIEEVAVPETWFFRDEEVFRFLATWARNEWWPRHPDRALRVLSLPCGSGEEAFTAVMALLDAGLPRFRAFGVDVRRSAVHKGRAAAYSAGSFRGDDLAYRDRYFTADGDDFQLSRLVTERVNLVVGNALDSCLLLGEEPFDAILCRNLLIYLTTEARERVLANLERLLQDHGVLLVGHAEADAFARAGFRSLRRPGVSAFRCATSQASSVMLTRPARAQSTASTTISRIDARHRPASPRADVTRPRHRPASVTSGLTPQVEPASSSHGSGLSRARRLADGGRLDEAIELCESYLEDHRDCAEAFFLLGILHQATGANGRAEEALHKVVYLEPENYEALMCLALHKERRGERAAAAALQRRAERTLDKNGRPDGTERDGRNRV